MLRRSIPAGSSWSTARFRTTPNHTAPTTLDEAAVETVVEAVGVAVAVDDEPQLVIRDGVAYAARLSRVSSLAGVAETGDGPGARRRAGTRKGPF